MGRLEAGLTVTLLIRLLWVFLFLACLVPTFSPLLASLEEIVTIVPDDAFYYFETAQRIAQGEGLTFDGVDLADGFQPLWLALLVPLALLPPLAFVKAALALEIALHFLALALLGRTAFRITGSQWPALFACFIYGANSWSIVNSVNGLETALASALFCLTLLLVLEHSLSSSQDRHSWRWARLIGISIGLLFLARTDQILYAGGFLLFSLFWVKDKWTWIRRVAVVGLTVAGPWFVWHYWLTGSLVPSSGVAQPLIMRTSAMLNGSSSFEIGWSRLRGFFDGRIFSFTGFNRYLLAPSLLIGAALVAIRWKRLPEAQRKTTILLLLLGTGGLALAFVHTFVRWYPRTWYFDQYILLVATFGALGLASLLQLSTAHLLDQPKHAAGVRLLGLALVAVLALHAAKLATTQGKRLQGPLHTTRQYTVEVVDWFDERLPDDVAVAAWNSGVLAFLSDRPVINLDGAISATTLPYLEARDLTSLLCERQVHYIADVEPDFGRYQPFLPGYERYTSSAPIVMDQFETWTTYRIQKLDSALWQHGCEPRPTPDS